MKSRRPRASKGKKPFSTGGSRRDSRSGRSERPERPFKSSRPGKASPWKEDSSFSARRGKRDEPERKSRFKSQGRDEKPSFGRKPGRRDSEASGKRFDRSDSRPGKPFDRSDSRPTGYAGRNDSRPGRSFDRDDSRPGKTFDRKESRPARSYERGSRPGKPYEKRGAGRDRQEDKPFERRGSDDRKPRFEREGPGRPGDRKWNRKEKHTFYGEKRRPASRKETGDAESDGLTRLNKYIANAGICSRREADELIRAGVVTVNGEVVTEMGYKVKPGDEVRYNNETLKSEKMVYVLLNKPKDFITTSDDPENRKTVMSLVENACRERIYPVGRLDRNTSGLLLFTNDGELARRLTHPSFEVQKIYQVDLDKNLKPADMEKISSGLELEDGYIKPDAVSYVGNGSDKSVVGIELHSGRNRIVRRIFEELEYKVKKLDRVYFAGLSKKDLPRGRWRFLTELEVAGLKMLTGDKKFKNLPTKQGAASVD